MHRSSLYDIFPPPPKPPKRNYIQENIKQLRNMHVSQKQDNNANLFSINKRIVPPLKLGSRVTNQSKEAKLGPMIANHHKKETKLTNCVTIANQKVKQTTKRNFTTNKVVPKLKHYSSVPNFQFTPSQAMSIKSLSNPHSPKYRNVGCQYLESDSRYYFADGSTVHFVYPSEYRKPIVPEKKSNKKASMYLSSTESYRRKQSTKMLHKKNQICQENVPPVVADATCQYSESDFVDPSNELADDVLSYLEKKSDDVMLHKDIVIPKLNLKKVDEMQGEGSMASIIEAGRTTKTQDSLRSNNESDVTTLHNDVKLPQTVDMSIVPMIDVQQELNDQKSEKSFSNEDAMKKLKNQFSKKVDELNHMPMRSDTLRSKTRKMQLERELMELEKNIKMLSYSKSKMDVRTCL